MTEEEIARRIKESTDRYRDQALQRIAEKEDSLEDTEYLKQWTLFYSTSDVAYAYSRKEDGTGMAFFTVKSPKDSFSRRAARKALARHGKSLTHCFKFVCPRVEGEFLDQMQLESVLGFGVLGRMASHPKEFSRQFRDRIIQNVYL